MTFSERLKFVFSKVWDFIAPFVRIFLSSAGQILGAVALQVVRNIAQDTTLVTDSDKRSAAFDAIVVDLKGKGIELGLQVTTSMINAAIEAAVMDQPIVALADIYATPERLQPEALLPIVLRALQQTLRQFAVGGFAASRDAWLAAHLWQGAAVRISEAGTAVLDGELRGVDTDGALCIATPAGMERVITGDVSLRKV